MEKKITLKNSKLKEKNIVAAVAVILLTAVVMIVSYIRIYQITEENCLERMQEAVDNIMDDISSKLDRDSLTLNAVAEIISKEEEFSPDAIRPIIKEFEPLMTARHLGVLLPGDVIIYGTGTTVDASQNDTIRFDEESKLGEHITDRKTSLNPDDNSEEIMVIRHFVPIEKNGEVVAMLFKTTYLSDLPATLKVDNIYNGSADVFILDMRSENGDLLMDTWHDGPLGSMKTSFGIQESKGDITFEQGIDDQLNGGTGHMLIKAPSINEYVFYYYAPINTDKWQLGGTDDYNQWSVAVSVPENEAYATLYTIRAVYFIIAGIEAVILVLYLIWTVRNTTVTLEKAVLQERLTKAENAERAKTMFLSNMSHDIRTPMNAIIGYTTLATTNIDDSDRVKDYLSKILSSSNHLLSLINDVLDMSRIESGRVFLEESECSLPDILRDLRNILQSQMKSKQLDFFMDTIDVVDENIWCDKLHLNQVLINLLSNAIKFTPAGGAVSLSIKQKPGAPEGYASYEIRVKDTGIGMSKEFAERVFEPFERERNSTVSGIQG
ncbi:MAG: HAMP domain-containing histidine kinase, partial [Oscillospiraceae bacterium]|nr:HAMP domain-containing histidine kinase [Oscillospiraceae bacterium]